MQIANARRQRRPTSPGIVQIGLALVIAVVLAAVTLTTRQPPPPAIAEFAPQAAEQIKEQPKEQASQFGSGAGPGDCPPGAQCDAGEGDGVGGGGGTSTSSAAPEADPSVPPRKAPPGLKRCVGDPPRQIEDPQSPPCIAYWDDAKGNGGSTSPGVTKDEIVIAAADQPANGLYGALSVFFNKRFQLYGRQIRLVKPSNNGTAGADQVKEFGAFASLPNYADVPFYRQLVRHKIIGIYRTPEFSDSELAASAPYIYGYSMSYTQMLANLGDWACRRLHGQKATHAGRIDAAQLSTYDRSFAIFQDLGTPDSTANPNVLKAALEQCGAKVPFLTTYPRYDNDPIRIRTEIARIKELGVTTVFCLCVTTNLSALQQSADSQLYEPEWVMSSYPQLVQGETHGGSQMVRTFGVSFGPMDRVPEDHPLIWAVREGDPTGTVASTGNVGSDDLHYRAFLALMSGIQMAGPNLTPETFRAGLQRTKFPNPEHPIMAGKVGFEGDFSMTNDGAEWWWSEHDAGAYDPDGPTYCWVDGGRRHAKGTWPKGGDPFFKGPCDGGARSVS